MARQEEEQRETFGRKVELGKDIVAGGAKREKKQQKPGKKEEENSNNRGKKGEQKAKRSRRHRMDQREVSKWSMTFEAAYEDALRKRWRRGEGYGPIDIENSGNRRLLIILQYRVDATFPWERLKARWETPFPEFRAARVLEKVQDTGRARVVWRKVETRMKERKIPLRRHLIFRMEEDVPKHVTKRALREAMKEQELEPEVEKWISSEMKILSKPTPTFFTLRNAGASVRAAKMEEVKAEFETSEDRIIGGNDFRRVGGARRFRSGAPNLRSFSPFRNARGPCRR